MKHGDGEKREREGVEWRRRKEPHFSFPTTLFLVLPSLRHPKEFLSTNTSLILKKYIYIFAKLLWIIIDGTEIQGTLARQRGSAAHD